MKWITRANAKIDRVACPWLIKKYIDKNAEFLFVPKDQVLDRAEKENAKSFDAPGADYTHRGNKCTFEVLIEDFGLKDPALNRLAKIVHGADIKGEINPAPESVGLLAIATGFNKTIHDDHEKLRLQFPIYDALYSYLCSILNFDANMGNQ